MALKVGGGRGRGEGGRGEGGVVVLECDTCVWWRNGSYFGNVASALAGHANELNLDGGGRE